MNELLAQAIVATLLTNQGAPEAAHRPSCATVRQSARIVGSQAYANYPEIARLQNQAGSTIVRVDLSESGSVLGSSVAASSGNMLLDREAMRTARELAYSPETNDCKPIAGSYAVEVEFTER